MKFAILASTNGTDIPAIIEAFSQKIIPGELICGIVNNQNCGAQTKMKKANIPTFLVDHHNKNRKDFDNEIDVILQRNNIDYIVCIGFMRIFSKKFTQKWEQRIINVHPSLLPAFPGNNSIHEALKYGVKVTGVTVHFIDEGIDTGKIIAQKAIEIESHDSAATLKIKIQKEEQMLLIEVLKNLSH